MGREIRRVPPGFQHPVFTEADMLERPYVRHWTKAPERTAAYKPLHNGLSFERRTKEWHEEFKKWRDGGRDETEKKYGEYDGLSDEQAFNEWWGPLPDPADYTDIRDESLATHYQIYEDVSEGTPVSPIFATTDELIEWLTGPRGTPDDPWDNRGQTLEAAKRFVEWGSAPSMVLVTGAGGGIFTGIEGCDANPKPIPIPTNGEVIRTAQPDLNWNVESREGYGGSLIGYLDPLPWSFEETVARLVTLTGQAAKSPDHDKVSVEFCGKYRGQTFTLYDYKCDGQLHIGGNRPLSEQNVREAVLAALQTVEPTPYKAKLYYEGRGSHRWPPK